MEGFSLRSLHFFGCAAKFLTTKYCGRAGRHGSKLRKKPGEAMGRKQAQSHSKKNTFVHLCTERRDFTKFKIFYSILQVSPPEPTLNPTKLQSLKLCDFYMIYVYFTYDINIVIYQFLKARNCYSPPQHKQSNTTAFRLPAIAFPIYPWRPSATRLHAR